MLIPLAWFLLARMMTSASHCIKISAFLWVFCDFFLVYTVCQEDTECIAALHSRGGILRCSQQHVPIVVSPYPPAQSFAGTVARLSNRQASLLPRSRQRYVLARRRQEPSTRQHSFNRRPRRAH